MKIKNIGNHHLAIVPWIRHEGQYYVQHAWPILCLKPPARILGALSCNKIPVDFCSLPEDVEETPPPSAEAQLGKALQPVAGGPLHFRQRDVDGLFFEGGDKPI